MDDKGQNAFTQVVKYVLFLLPLFGLIWGAAVMYVRVLDNSKRIDQLEQRQELSIDRLTVQVADMNLNIKELQTEVRLLRSSQ